MLPGFHALLYHRVAHWLWRRRLAARRTVRLASRARADRDRDPPRRHDRPAAVYRPRHGRGDRRDRRDRRRLHALPGRDPRRHLAHAAGKSATRRSATASSSAPARRCWGRSGSATARASAPPRWCCARCPTARRWSATRRARSPGAAPPPSRGRPSSPTAVCGDIPDPIARALNGLLDEVASLRARVDELEQRSGSERRRAPAPVLRRRCGSSPRAAMDGRQRARAREDPG